MVKIEAYQHSLDALYEGCSGALTLVGEGADALHPDCLLSSDSSTITE